MLIAGRYRLERKLSEDAIAASWRAEDTALARSVRLKLLRQDRLHDAQAAEAFRREVRAAAQDTSIATGRVLDGGDDPDTGLPFVVFEDEFEDSPTQALPIPVEAPPRPVAAPPRGVAPPAARTKPRRRTDRLWIVLLLAVPLLVGIIAIGNWISQPVQSVAGVFRLNNDVALPTPAAVPTEVAGQKPVGVAPTATPGGAARPTPTPSPQSGQRRRVANTDGQGVALRREPDGERFPGRGYNEGDVVTLLEERGRWARIRGDDGREGWVLAVTLVP